MSIVKALLSRQFHPSGGSIGKLNSPTCEILLLASLCSPPGSQRWLLKDMKLHHQDVVQLEDEFQDMEVCVQGYWYVSKVISPFSWPPCVG